MAQVKPYQPSLLRLLHGLNALLVLGALISGFLVYNTFDGRWGKLPLPRINPIIDIHGTIALTFFLFTPLFFFYSLWMGYKRLIQKSSLSQLTQVGTPAGWSGWQRLMNTLMLVASLMALGTGKLMLEEWLPTGELSHLPYLLHLLSWVVLLVGVILHLLLSAKVGGRALLASMLSFQIRDSDRPQLWWQKIRTRRE